MVNLRASRGCGTCCAGIGEGKLALFAVAGIVLVLDRISKAAVSEWMPYGDSHSVIDGFFNLVHVRNTGIAFSLFADSAPWFRDWTLPLISVVAVVAILAMLRKQAEMQSASRVALALILAGAIGNLYDRLLYGYVTDFLDFYLGSYHWPAFNVADSAITVGAALLIVDSFGERRPLRNPSGMT